MKRVLMLSLLTLGITTLANAQATRTWVSGVGDDANPCSRTAPCKTFAGAISKTASPGIINCLDPGGFGAVTVTKSIMIDCTGTLGSVLSSGVQGIIVNALTTDKIILRNIDISGAGTTLGTNGINVIQAASVSVEGVTVETYSGAGIELTNSSNNITLSVKNSIVENVGNVGIFMFNSGGQDKLVVTDTTVQNISNIGIDVGGALDNADLVRTTVTRATNAALQVENGTSNAMLDGVNLTYSGTGIFAGIGASAPTIRLARCSITGNTVNGIGGGGSGITRCFGSNVIEGNTGNNACSAPNVAQQ
jgi:hypothetical protein